MLTVTDSCI